MISKTISMEVSALPPKFIVQPATAQDVEDIATLDRKMWKEWANPLTLYRQLIDIFPDTVLVARSSHGEYAGCAVGLVRPNPLVGWVLSIDIAEQFRGQGLGKQCITTMLAAFGRLGVSEVVAVIDPSNEASQKLFSSFGFKKAELLSDYFGPGKDQHRWVLQGCE